MTPAAVFAAAPALVEGVKNSHNAVLAASFGRGRVSTLPFLKLKQDDPKTG